MQIKDLAYPNTKYVKCNTTKTPESPTTSCYILQNASQHAFLTAVTYNPLHSGRYVTSTEPLRAGFLQPLQPLCKSHTCSFYFEFCSTEGFTDKRVKDQGAMLQ